MKNFVAILSTTVIPMDGTYTVITIPADIAIPMLAGVPHYVGHPSTKALLDEAGATYTPGLFVGLQPGEGALCVSIAQGKSSRGELGKTVDQDVVLEDLTFRVLRRAAQCPFCGEASVVGTHCCACGGC